MFTYLEQMEAHAVRTGVGLRAACLAEGIAVSTLNRWRAGTTTPNENIARRIFNRMDAMSAEEVA